MATIDTIADRSTGTAIAGKMYFETSTNKLIAYSGSAWLELDSDGTGAVYENRWGASFDGSNDYLSFSNTFGIPGSTSASMSCWINCSNTNVNQHISGTNNKVFSVELWGSSNVLYVEMGSGKYATLSSMRSYISQGSWHHIAVVYDGSGSSNADKIKLYIDGALMTVSFSGTIDSAMPSFSNFYFGKGTYNVYYDGLLDEAAIFNTALSAADITAIYYGGTPNHIGSFSPVGYWRMGDDSNDTASSDPASNKIATITDSSGNGNDATQGTASSQPTFMELDQSTTSLSFDGSNDNLTVSDSSLDISGDLTMSFWFKANSFSNWNYAFNLTTFPTTSASSYRARTLGFYDGKLNSNTYYDGWNDAASTSLQTNTWYHAAVVYERTAGTDTGFHTLYLNGAVDLARTAVNMKDINYVETQIGKSYNSEYFDGLLDDVAVFNSALSASEVSSLAASRGAHIVNDLSLSPVVYYRMGEDDSLTDGAPVLQITDASGNGNHATQSTAANQPTASVDTTIYV